MSRLVLIHTGTPQKTTGELTQMVRDLPDECRSQKMKTLGKLVFQVRDILKTNDIASLALVFNEAQAVLNSLGVSTEKMNSLGEKIQKIGGGAKLVGAGGGGFMLAVHEDSDKLKKTIVEMGFEPMQTDLGTAGVRAE